MPELTTADLIHVLYEAPNLPMSSLTLPVPRPPSIIARSLDAAAWLILEPLIHENHAAAGIDAALRLDFRKLERCSPRVWILWDEGEAVGYCAHIVAPHLFTGEITATCAAIYVRPTHRAKVRGMLDHIEADLRAGGAVLINYSVPHMSRAGSFFEAIGYECRELVMSKRLEPAQ